jgi:catechol 2,3-dioxygenase-like lactoylglutathione lyase family enzyme
MSNFYKTSGYPIRKLGTLPNPREAMPMKFWSGVITNQVQESKDFYVRLFGCEVVYESDWFVLLQLGGAELGFMSPNLESQAPVFRPAFQGHGLWISVEVDDVDAEYQRLRAMAVPIEAGLRDEPWGDRHFVLLDPNGIGVDVVQRR